MGYTVAYKPMGDKVSFIDIKNEINEIELQEIIKLGEFDVIQCRVIPSIATLKLWKYIILNILKLVFGYMVGFQANLVV